MSRRGIQRHFRTKKLLLDWPVVDGGLVVPGGVRQRLRAGERLKERRACISRLLRHVSISALVQRGHFSKKLFFHIPLILKLNVLPNTPWLARLFCNLHTNQPVGGNH